MRILFAHTQPYRSRTVQDVPMPPRVGDHVSFDGDTEYKVERVVWQITDLTDPAPSPDDVDVYILLEPR